MTNRMTTKMNAKYSLPSWSSSMTLDYSAGGRGFKPALAKQRIKFLDLLSLPAGVGLSTVSGVAGCASRQSVTSGEA